MKSNPSTFLFSRRRRITILFFSLTLIIISKTFDLQRIEPCSVPPLKNTWICDIPCPISQRINYLLSILSIDEKINLMFMTSPEIKRLNITKFNWRCECLHGLAHSSCEYGKYKVTSYPQAINLGRTFDLEKIQMMTGQISDEGWALYNVGQFDGVSFFSPNVNIYRDPRWGRGQETPGEDPYWSARYVVAFVRGLQEGKDPRYIKAVAGAKHYTAYDVDNWNGIVRHTFDAIVSKRDLEETFQPPFKAAVVEGKVKQIMCSYNKINGIPACANKYLLDTVARKEWGFEEGQFVSDLGAIKDMYETHKWVKTPEEAVAKALKAGVDLNDGYQYTGYLHKALDMGLVTMDDIDKGLTRILNHRIKLGEFDSPWKDQYYRTIPISVLNSQKHLDLSYQLALESMVLLKNEDNILPLDPSKYQSIAVIGPNANATTVLQGNYVGSAQFLISVREGIMKYVNNTLYSKGCEIDTTSKKLFKEAKDLASNADATILVMGLNQTIERESLDRNYISWPGTQLDLIKEIKASSKGPVILVMIKAGSIDISYSKKEIDGIIDAGYPSMFGGDAVADVLFGKYSPSGRLTTTVYPENYVHNVKMTDMEMRPHGKNPGQTYRFYTGETIYEFGFGLSYTTFTYEWTESSFLDYSMLDSSKNVSVIVTNTGTVESDCVVLAFVKNTFIDDAPVKELFGVNRIHLKPGEKKQVDFEVEKKIFEYVDVYGIRNIYKGEYIIDVENISKKVILT